MRSMRHEGLTELLLLASELLVDAKRGAIVDAGSAIEATCGGAG
ncbi:hypothetical protein ACPA54_12395 [Uniformispora flossi]